MIFCSSRGRGFVVFGCCWQSLNVPPSPDKRCFAAVRAHHMLVCHRRPLTVVCEVNLTGRRHFVQSNKIRVEMKTSASDSRTGSGTLLITADSSLLLSACCSAALCACCFVVDRQNKTENKNDENLFSNIQPDFMQSLPVVSFQNKGPDLLFTRHGERQLLTAACAHCSL